MSLELQYKIKSNPKYLEYLREHSIWYKYLNRSQYSFKDFVSSVNAYYGLRPSDKIAKMINNINMLQTFLDVLK